MDILFSVLAIGMLIWVLLGSFLYCKKHALSNNPWLFMLKSFGVYLLANFVFGYLSTWLLAQFLPYILVAFIAIALIGASVWYYWQWEYKRVSSNPRPDEGGWSSAGSDQDWN